METVIVQPVPMRAPEDVVHLLPGDTVAFGRGYPGRGVGLRIDHCEVPRRAGLIGAADDHWTLSNLSRDRTYVVENPEGAGEHVKVAPRRLGAPIPFEVARLVLPVTAGRAELLVLAPQHAYADPAAPPGPEGEATAAGFALDETAKYFLILVALCEPRLRDQSSAAVPSLPQVLARLAPLPGCAGLTRTAANFHLDYLARTKLRLREYAGREAEPAASRLEWRAGALVSFALRFDLVREEHLRLLPARPGRPVRAGQAVLTARGGLRADGPR